MEATIRKAKPEDMSSVLEMIQELAAFEKAPEAVIVNEQDLIRDGFGENPRFNVNIAEIDSDIVGMALFYVGYSTWKGTLVYLDDLIVKSKYRNHKIGTQLLQSVIAFSKQVNAKVLKWQVLNWNEDAIRFYKRHDVVFDDEWIDCKLYYIEGE